MAEKEESRKGNWKVLFAKTEKLDQIQATEPSKLGPALKDIVVGIVTLTDDMRTE